MNKDYAITFIDNRVVMAHNCDNIIETITHWIDQSSYKFRDVIKCELVTDKNREEINRRRY